MIFILILVILFTILPNYSQKIAAIVSILSMVCGTYLQHHISLKLTPLSVSVSLRDHLCLFNFQISKYVYRVTDSEMNIRAEIKDLKSEQETISMTEEFAKYAKLQRKIDKHTAEVKRLGMCKHMRSNFVISN